MTYSDGKILHSIYYDVSHPASFSNALKLYQAAKLKKSSIKKEAVYDWLLSQDTYTLFRKRNLKFKRMVTLSYGIDERWQADIMDMSRFAKYNNNVKYILVCIDILSRYAFGFPLKDKSAQTVKCAFEEIFKQRKPQILTTDQGKEFKNNIVQSFLKETNVKYMSTTTDDTKCAVVERLLRTLREKIWKYLNSKSTFKYVDKLQDFFTSYNTSMHRILKMRPKDVTKDNQQQAYYNLYGHLRLNFHKKKFLKPGSFVRISKKKEKFEKGADPNFSEEIFKVDEVHPGRIKPFYKISDQLGEDISSIFYAEELQETSRDSTLRGKVEKILKKRKVKNKWESLVKWKGYTDKFNSWIPLKNITNG